MSNIPETGRTPRVTARLVAVQIVVISLLLTLGGRLWYLQIRNGDAYAEEASNNHVQQVVQPAVRGSILDARGVPLADNETRLVVSADRSELTRMDDGGEAVLARVAKVLGMSEKEVRQKVRLCDADTPQPCWNGSPYQPIPITDEATTKQALTIRERQEDFPGIIAEPTAVRRYPAPHKAVSAQVLGYLGPVTDEEVAEAEDSDSPLLRSDMIGRSGLERQYDEYLRGKAGYTRYKVDHLGRVIGAAEKEPARAGDHLITSIDSRVQAVAERELDKAMKEARQQVDDVTGRRYKADSGAVVVMESKTGRVVAMASMPDYDPNAWVGGISPKEYAKLTGEDSNHPLLNRAIQGQGPPGSIFKVVSASAAVRAGHKFNGRYPCTSSYSVGGQTFKNFESQGYGDITLGRALEVSCNTVFYRLGHQEWRKDGGNKPKKNPKDWFYRTAEDFGLGSKTGIDLPDEVSGRIPGREWKRAYWEANHDAWCKQGKSDKNDYVTRLARENCLEGMKLRAGDSINYAIGQGDVLVTPVQMASIYAALSNGGTLYAPQVGKAIVSPDGKEVRELEPKKRGELPISDKTRRQIDKALEGVATRGTAAWRFAQTGWPQERIPMHAKTGTAQRQGKQTTSWLATYTDEYTIVMTISQAGTGSGASGPAVRAIYDAIYGLGGQEALLPKPKKDLPKIRQDGSIEAEKDKPKDKKKGQRGESSEGGETAGQDAPETAGQDVPEGAARQDTPGQESPGQLPDQDVPESAGDQHPPEAGPPAPGPPEEGVPDQGARDDARQAAYRRDE